MKTTYTRRQRLIRHAKLGVGAAVALFLVINISFAYLVDQQATELRDPEYQNVLETLQARQREQPTAALTLFMGSSRVALGVDAGQFNTPKHLVFNFGMAGAGPYMMDVYWERLQTDGIQPQVVIIEVMHPFYNASGRTLDHSFLDGSRLSVQEAQGLMHYGKRSTGPLRRLGLARLFPTTRHNQELSDYIGLGALNTGHQRGEWTPILDRYGYRPLPVPPEKQADMCRLAHQQYDQYYPQFTLADDAAKRLEQLIEKVQHSGAVVKLLLTPEGTEFRGQASHQMQECIQQWVTVLQTQYHCDVIDARDWLPDSAFYDQHHLLPEGGRLFAERLKSTVLMPR